MPTEESIQTHRMWAAQPKPPRDIYAALCAGCGCAGNIECGKKTPLAAPEHHCELDINDENESHRCYCCRLAGVGDTINGIAQL